MWPNLQETVDLVTFTEEILNGKFHFFVQYKTLIFGTFGYEVHICHTSYIHKKAYFNEGRTFSEGNILKLKMPNLWQ